MLKDEKLQYNYIKAAVTTIISRYILDLVLRMQENVYMYKRKRILSSRPLPNGGVTSLHVIRNGYINRKMLQ